MDSSEDPVFHYVNLEKVCSDSKMSAVVRTTAQRLMSSPYMTLKEFFQTLGQHDLDFLSSLVDAALYKSDEAALLDLVVLTEMLTVAEGSSLPATSRESESNLTYFCTLISCVSLERKGLVEVSYDRLTFDHEYDNETVVKLKGAGS